MGNRILEIVVFLMDHMRENHGSMPDMDDVSLELRNLGYSDGEISSAYTWVVDRFDGSTETFFTDFPIEHFSNRVLTPYERIQLPSDVFGFLIKLINLKVIDDEQFEAVLERSMTYGTRPISLDQIKAIASAVLFDEVVEPDGPSVFDAKIDPSLNIN
jgi:uncharacterized protein Smg (DUF494 family)